MLFKSSLTIRTLKRSIYFLGIVREMAAEKTAGQDLAPLYPSVLFRSPTPPPPSLIGYKNRDNNENKKNKSEGEVQYIAQANCGSRLWLVEAHTAALHRAGFIFPNTPPALRVLGTHPILQMICTAL